MQFTESSLKHFIAFISYIYSQTQTTALFMLPWNKLNFFTTTMKMTNQVPKVWFILMYLQILLGLVNHWKIPHISKGQRFTSLVYNASMVSIMLCYALLTSLCRSYFMQNIGTITSVVVHLSWTWLVSLYYLLNLYNCISDNLKQLYSSLQMYLQQTSEQYPAFLGFKSKVKTLVIVLLSSIVLIYLTLLTYLFYFMAEMVSTTVSVDLFMAYIYSCWELQGEMLAAAYSLYIILTYSGCLAVFTNVMFLVCTIYILCEELNKIQR